MKFITVLALIISLLTSSIVASVSGVIYITQQSDTEDTQALSNYSGQQAFLGGVPTRGYDETVFLITQDEEDKYAICGGAHIGNNVAITAAHCVDNVQSVVIGKEAIDVSESNFVEIRSAELYEEWDGFVPSWTFDEVQDDFAFVTFNDTGFARDTATIAPAEIGCNYVIASYGKRTGESQVNLSENRNLEIASICIEEMDDTVMLLVPESTEGFCEGDSGSPIFERDTGRIVGILSSVTGETVEDLCTINNRALGIRLDAKASLIEEQVPDARFATGIGSTQGEQSTDSISDVLSDDYDWGGTFDQEDLIQTNQNITEAAQTDRNAVSNELTFEDLERFPSTWLAGIGGIAAFQAFLSLLGLFSPLRRAQG